MATLHVTSVAALMLEKNPTLSQSQVEMILKTSAAPISHGLVSVFDIVDQDNNGIIREFITISWEQELGTRTIRSNGRWPGSGQRSPRSNSALEDLSLVPPLPCYFRSHYRRANR